MSRHATQREFALEIVRRLREAGFDALWAGGCVRDQLLGFTPKDYDVATNARPDEIRDLFGRRRTLAIGAAFGVVTVLPPRGLVQVDVATFRSDAAYSDGRHPDSVTFTDAEHDAQRRDFTINGLFFDPVAEQVVDFVGGQADLAARVVRAIGDARQRIGEDKLRMLRAIRFSATYGFAIDSATMDAIRGLAPEIVAVSAERIGMELRRMLVHANRATALRLLRESQLLPHVLPELVGLPDTLWRTTLERLERLVAPSLSVALSAAMFSVDGADLAVIGRRLRFTNKEIERSQWLTANASRVLQAPSLPWPEVQPLLVHEGGAELVAFAEAICDAPSPAIAFCRERLSWPEERLNPKPLLDGGELIRVGLSPGPSFSAILECVRSAQLEGEISTRDEALAMVDRLRPPGDTLR